jgi:hypothetical protein
MTQFEIHPKKIQERASILSLKGSVTLEMALTLPIFLFAVVCLMYVMEIQILQSQIRLAACNTAKQAAQSQITTSLFLYPVQEARMVQWIGSERLNQSILKDNEKGVSCRGSYLDDTTGELHLRISYVVELPVPQFLGLSASYNDEILVKVWNGYLNENSEDGELVYITETATVYHEKYTCTYLKLSIKQTTVAEVSALRNDYGVKYVPCEKCKFGAASSVLYVTNQGNKYHRSATCSGLKRQIQTVKKSEVGYLHGCSRCCE